MVGSIGPCSGLEVDDLSEDESDIEERMLCVTSATGMITSPRSERNKVGELTGFTDRTSTAG